MRGVVNRKDGREAEGWGWWAGKGCWGPGVVWERHWARVSPGRETSVGKTGAWLGRGGSLRLLWL